jgi:MtN3 and saliva related transmembrane protein
VNTYELLLKNFEATMASIDEQIMNTLAAVVGFVAGVLTTIAFVPQVIRIWRTRSTKDISLSMYALFTLGVLLWFVYGILIVSWPVIVANGITLVLALSVLAMKLKFG